MKYAIPIARLLLGLPFLFFGLNWFFRWIEPPAEMPSKAQALLEALDDTGFMHPLRGATEALCGALLLTGLWVPLALVILAPVMVHIIGYHVYLDTAGLPITAVLVALQLFVAWSYRRNFTSLFQRRIAEEVSAPRGTTRR